MSTDDTTIAVIEEQADTSIRRLEVEGIWYFSVIDVIAVLTDSASPGAYWRKLKQRLLEDEGASQTVTNCHTLKMTAADGKQRATDAADVETLLRLIQSIPSPKAEPVKLWLARVGAKKLEELTPVPLGTSVAELRQNKPPDDADAVTLADYYEQLAALYRRQAHLESRLRFVEAASEDHEQQLESLQSRMEAVEEGQRMLPELLERLGPERLTPQHQALVKRWVQELHTLAGYAFSTIYSDLNGAFHVGKFSDILETDWERVEQVVHIAD